ncbi:uncharacterized protein LOC111460010 [Cucurbita moschata]|uniref:Uncharacterized protein LOC111460010 n=1 Tax=Cucurbita moschata TaxID=3662 RepID=A0A6J1H3B0_CUCMO|nr:uncharacterized protein LOC111460010 [Cucurbita moschata]
MLLLKIDCADFLLEVIYILNRFAESANVECSPDLFSIAVTHHSLELNVAFQMMPEFFTLFYSHKSHVSKILLSPLYYTIRRMQYFNIPLAALYVLRRPERLNLKFTPPGNEMPLLRNMSMTQTMKGHMGQINLETFVSIDSEVFRRMVIEFRGYVVYVHLTSSNVTFSIEIKDIVLEQEEGECIIGGTEGELTDFLIPLCPWHVFYTITYHSRRVWLFKAIDRSTMIVAPVGLYAQYAMHFPLG